MIAEIITQLEAAQLNNKPLFRKVEEAVDVKRALGEKIQHGSVAYVIEVNRRPQANSRHMGPAVQNIVTTIGVLVGVKKINDPTGTKTKAVVEPVLVELRKTLFGFKPTVDHSPLLLDAADFVGTTESAMWKLERFKTEHLEESIND